MKKKILLIITLLLLLSIIGGYIYWQQYENSRLQPYYQLNKVINTECEAIGEYNVKNTRDLGKEVDVRVMFNYNQELFKVMILQSDRSNETGYLFYKISTDELLYGYTYDDKANTLLAPPKESERKYPPKEFRDTFEQEMKERLKSC